MCLQLLSRLSRARTERMLRLRKISKARPACERSRRSRSHRQITLPGFFLVVTGKSRENSSKLSSLVSTARLFATRSPEQQGLVARSAVQSARKSAALPRARSKRSAQHKKKPSGLNQRSVQHSVRDRKQCREKQAVPREVHLGGTIALSLSVVRKASARRDEKLPRTSQLISSRPKESVVSCASEIRIADASTSVESGATTACAHTGYRVPFAKAVSTSGATYVARRTLLSQLLMQVPLSKAGRSPRGTRLITTFCMDALESRISKTVDSVPVD